MNEQLYQALLLYSEEQYADFCERRETFAQEVFNFALDEFSKRPAFYSRSKIHLQHEVAKFIKQQVIAHLKREEIMAEYYAQRAVIVIEMLRGHFCACPNCEPVMCCNGQECGCQGMPIDFTPTDKCDGYCLNKTHRELAKATTRNHELEASHISAVDYGVKLQRIIELEAAVVRKDEALEYVVKTCDIQCNATPLSLSLSEKCSKALSPISGLSLLGELERLREIMRELRNFTYHRESCLKHEFMDSDRECTCGLSALLSEEGKG